VAIPTAEHLADLADGWAEAFAGVVARLAATGVEIVEVDIAPLLEAATLLYGGAFVAERTAAVGDHITAHPELVGTDLDAAVAAIVLGGRDATAVEYLRDRERLDHLGAAGLAALEDTDALLTPTTTWHPTLAEVAADPIGANSRMGRFTNFANLLDRSALAVPAGRVDGLPFGVMLTGAPFADRALAELARRIQDPFLELLVVGAHLAGQPLNHQLVAAGGSLVAAVETAAAYRLFALDTVPPKPGLVRVAEGGSRIAGEVWRLPAAGLGSFVAALPAPMAIGSVELDDGSRVTGFLVEPFATPGALDISGHGGWRAYRAATAAAAG
jgi:allophanate hydrolase